MYTQPEGFALIPLMGKNLTDLTSNTKVNYIAIYSRGVYMSN